LARRFVKKRSATDRIEGESMPKLLVLCEEESGVTKMLADAAASGARGVRFMEVDVRTAVSLAPAREYDAILFATGGVPSVAIDRTIAELASAGDTSNTVFAAVGVGAPAVIARCVEAGGIVAAVRGGDAKATGVRAAKVAGWVRHGLGHEAEHHHHEHHH
jgi:hypothetical protein